MSGQTEAVMAAILAERVRQLTVEGWSRAHDDQHDNFEMARAAACYARYAGLPEGAPCPEKWWPWDKAWWKPKGDARRDLIRAAALIVAELERLDRLVREQE